MNGKRCGNRLLTVWLQTFWEYSGNYVPGIFLTGNARCQINRVLMRPGVGCDQVLWVLMKICCRNYIPLLMLAAMYMYAHIRCIFHCAWIYSIETMLYIESTCHALPMLQGRRNVYHYSGSVGAFREGQFLEKGVSTKETSKRIHFATLVYSPKLWLQYQGWLQYLFLSVHG